MKYKGFFKQPIASRLLLDNLLTHLACVWLACFRSLARTDKTVLQTWNDRDFYWQSYLSVSLYFSLIHSIFMVKDIADPA